MLSHDHADHGSGLKRIMREFGTQEFLYSKDVEEETDVLTMLLDYVNRGNVDIPNESVDVRYTGQLGVVDLAVLWPQHDVIDRHPNNNSIVLALTLANVTFLLTGDAEGKVWNNLANGIPDNTMFVKVPHHGSRNGTIHRGGFPWLDQTDNFANRPSLGISCHPNYPRRYDLPDDIVLDEFRQRNYSYYRTDQHYHVTYETDGNNISVRYSH
jgi:beta-lactamase superfamily II metal-dependent hydrolase